MIGAFLIGFLGSLHCVGMCGPVMLAFNGTNAKSSGVLLYHGGRIFSYILIGLLLGAVSSFVSVLRIQQVATLLLGVAILLLYGVPRFRSGLEKFYYNSRFYKQIKSSISKNLTLRRRRLLSGVANGFFPCGLTYVAAAGSIVMPGFLSSALFMLLFGLGTLPALFVLHYSGDFLFKRFKAVIPKSLHLVALLSGLLLVYRGALMSFPDFDAKIRESAMGLITVCGF